MGGLSKKAFQFEKKINEEQLPALIVDSGNLLFKNINISAAQKEQVIITAKGIVEGYAAIGYHGVGVAAQDLTLGLDFLKEVADQSKFPWLSANLFNNSNDTPLFAPYTIANVGDLSIGLIGLTGKADNFLKDSDNAHIKPWQDVLPKIVSQLSPKTDMLVLLSNLSLAENKKIAKLYDIHVIIQSGVSTVNIAPVPYENTLICQTGKQGKYIGIMKVNWQDSKIWGEKTAEKLTKAKQNLDRLEWQLSKYKKYENPLVDLQDNPTKLRAYQRLIAKREQYLKEIDSSEAELARQEKESISPSTFENQFIAMKTTLPDEPVVLKIVEDINKAINDAGSKKTLAKNTLSRTYAGWQSCKKCHLEIFNSWSNTPHADAYATLVNKRQQFNLDCLFCHVTGIDKENVDLALSLSKEMRNVGCESCHGPARKHASEPDKFTPLKTPQESVCLQCHTDEHDDSFDYLRDIDKIHPL